MLSVNEMVGGLDEHQVTDATMCLERSIDDAAAAKAMAGFYVDGSGEHLAAMFAAALTACSDVLVDAAA